MSLYEAKITKVNHWTHLSNKLQGLYEVLVQNELAKYNNNIVLDLMEINVSFLLSVNISLLVKIYDKAKELDGEMNILCNQDMKDILCKMSFDQYIKLYTKREEIIHECSVYELVRVSIQNIKIKEILSVEGKAGFPLTIGRNSDCKIVINSNYVSRHQGSLEYKDGGWFFMKNSTVTNPSYLNFGKPLKDGDQIHNYSYLTFGGLNTDTFLIRPKSPLEFKNFELEKDRKIKKISLVDLRTFWKSIETSEKFEALKKNLAYLSNVINNVTTNSQEEQQEHLCDLLLLFIIRYFGDLSNIYIKIEETHRIKSVKSTMMVPQKIFEVAVAYQHTYQWQEENLHHFVIPLNNGVVYIETFEEEWKSINNDVHLDITSFFYSLTFFIHNLHKNLSKKIEGNRNMVFSREVTEGEEFQKYFWPKKLLFPDLKVHLRNEQYYKIGGDLCYAYQNADKNLYYIAFGDTQGHGVKSSLMATFMIGVLTTLFYESKYQLHEIVTEINRICLTLPEKILSQFILLQWNGQEIIYSNAGLCFPFICRNRDKKVEEIALHKGLPLGMSLNTSYRQNNIPMEDGDILVFYTDGITEAMDRDRKMYSPERLQQILAREFCNPQEIKLVDLSKKIFADVKSFTNGKIDDDISILLLRKQTSDELGNIELISEEIPDRYLDSCTMECQIEDSPNKTLALPERKRKDRQEL